MKSFRKFIGILLVLPGSALFAGDGPGGVGDTTGNSELRLWLNAGSGHGGYFGATDFSGAATMQGNIGQQFDDRGRRRETQFSPLAPAPILAMNLDDPEGATVAVDRLNPARNGTYVGASKYLTGERFFGSTAAIFADGGHVALPAISALNTLTGNFRINVWVKPIILDGFQRVLYNGQKGGGWGFGFSGSNVLFTTYGRKDFFFRNIVVKPGIWTQLQVEVFDNTNPTTTGDDGTLAPRKEVTVKVNGGLRDETFNLVPGSQVETVQGPIVADPSATNYFIAGAPGNNQSYFGGVAGLTVRPLDLTPVAGTATDATFSAANLSRLRQNGEIAELIRTARDQQNNNQSYARTFADPVPLLSTVNWPARITNEISIFVHARFDASSFRTNDGVPALLRSTANNLFIQIPDTRGRVGWHFGGAIANSAVENDASVTRVPFNANFYVDSQDFRTWGFFSSAAKGRRILENGFPLESDPHSSVTSIGQLDFSSIYTPAPPRTSGQVPHDISEVIIYNRDLNNAEVMLVNNYLRAKYHQPLSLVGDSIDRYVGDQVTLGDFDQGLIGIADLGGQRHTNASGGGLQLTDASFLSAAGDNTFLAAYKIGGLKAAALPSTVEMNWDRWWYFDIRGSNGNVQVSLDYTQTRKFVPPNSVPGVASYLNPDGLVVPPVTTHYLLYSSSPDGPFAVVASAQSSPTVVNFGNLTTGLQLKSGYYAIGHARPALVPTPATTYSISYDPTATNSPRSGNTWRVSSGANADTVIKTILTEINGRPAPLPADAKLGRPNDGSVYHLDLSQLFLPGAGAATSNNTFVIKRLEDWPSIRRNLVITGPKLPPGRFVLEAFGGNLGSEHPLWIEDGSVEIRNVTIRGRVSPRTDAGLGGGIHIYRGDVLLEDCIIKDNVALGRDGILASLNTASNTLVGMNGRFGERGYPSFQGQIPSGPFTVPRSVFGRGEGGDGGFGAGAGFGGNNRIASSHDGNFGGLGGFGANEGTLGIVAWRPLPLTPSTEEGQSGASAGLGGGIFQYRGALRLNRVALTGNKAQGGTGGIRYPKLPNGLPNFSSPTNRAVGLGGAIFCWEEARLASIIDSLVETNTADLAPGPAPQGGVNNVHFYGVGFPTEAQVNATAAIAARLAYINPLTGSPNESSPLSYQYRLYVKQGSVVAPRYDLLETTLAPQPKLTQLDADIQTLKTLASANPDSSYINRLLLDALFHRSTILGMKGDAKYQSSLAFPLNPAPPAGYQTDLDKDITDLTAAVDNYRLAIDGYFDSFKSPALYSVFKQFVPTIPYSVCYYEDAGVFRAVPELELANWQATRYRELALLFELLNDYGKSSEALIEFLIRRNNPAAGTTPSDKERALQLASNGQNWMQTWGESLLAMFPELEVSDFRTPGLERSIGLWTQSVTQLGTLQAALSGRTNPLGYTEDFLMLLPVDAIATQTGNLSFHSFDGFVRILDRPDSVLDQAVNSLALARTSQSNYVASRERLTAEATDLLQSSEDRLQTIAGNNPAQPWLGVGSEAWDQFNNIERAQNEITRNRIKINNLIEEINIERKRNDDAKGLIDKHDQIVTKYGDKISDIDDQIATIQISQDALAGVADALDPDLITGGPLGIGLQVFKLVNVAAQAGAEVGKLELESQKSELEGQQKAELITLDKSALDIDSQAYIKTRLLDMKELDLDSQIAAQNLRQETLRLAALLDEVGELQEKIGLAKTTIASRFYADPSQRLEVTSLYQDAIFNFREAQQWLFFATRALEYKRNIIFNQGIGSTLVNLQKLYQLRNADDLKKYFIELKQADAFPLGPQPRADWFSLRGDALGINGSAPEDDQAFRSKFVLKPNEFGQQKYFLNFSTLRTVTSGAKTFFEEGASLDRINTVKVLLTYNGLSPDLNRRIVGALRYGDTSYFRQTRAGVQDTVRPDQVNGEFTTYINRDWAQDPSTGRFYQARFIPQEFDFGRAFSTASDADRLTAVSGLTDNTSFRERSVAASNWEIRLPADIDFARLADVLIYFQHFSSPRQVGRPEEQTAAAQSP